MSSGEGVVRNLMVVFGVEVKNLHEAEKLQDGINAIEDGLNRLTSMALKATAGLTAFAGAIVLGTKPIADLAENTHKYAAAFGISAQRMQELTVGFEALGAKGDDLSDVFLQISEKARQATTGSKEAQKAFKDLGIDVKSLAGMNPDQLFDRLVGAFQNVGDAQTKFALISQIMGEDLGKKLLPIMTKGGASLDEYAKIARDAGAIMDESQVKMGLKVAGTYRKLMTVVSALKMRIGLELMPYVDRIGTKMWDWYQANKEFVKSKIHEYVKKVGNAMEWVKETAFQMKRLIDRMGGLEKVAKRTAAVFALITGLKIAGIFVSMASGIWTVISALVTGSGMFIAPVVAIVAAWGVGIGLILEDFAVFKRGGESLFGYFEKNADKLPMGFRVLHVVLKGVYAAVEGLGVVIAFLSKKASELFGDLLPLLPYIIAAVVGIGAAVVAFFIVPLTAVAFILVGIVKLVKAFGTLIGWVTDRMAEGFRMGINAVKEFGIGAMQVWDIVVGSLIEFIMLLPTVWDGVVKGMTDFFIAWFFEFVGLVASIPGIIWNVLQTPFNFMKAYLGEIGELIAGLGRGLGAVLGVAGKVGNAFGGELMGLAGGSIAQGQGQATMPWNSVATRESRNGANGGGTSNRNVNVTQGDTVIQVNGAGDPAAVAGKVQKAQKANMDRLFNGAANTAGGM